ncbi:MAG: hypothetical protein RL204_2210 [Bacteroidota bacterium]|jgi:aminopeptidase N
MNTLFKTIFLIVFLVIAQSQITGQQCHKKCNHSHSNRILFWEDPENTRSDTLNILNTDISLDLTLISQSQLKGVCSLYFTTLITTDSVHLDLEALTVDSVFMNNIEVLFEHTGNDLYIALPEATVPGADFTIEVHYHGDPVTDPSFGGFYFTPSYAYNLGVGFAADPHTYGRSWFPCFDNFVERSSFDMHVLTNNGRTSFCGGLLLNQEVVGQDSLLSHWHLEQEIPSYLASVAVSDYTHVDWEYTKQNGVSIPVWLTARAADTTDMKLSMLNLIPWLDASETHYGEYQWPRVGFVAVPFNGGAMEHATNIAYPLFAIDGTLGYETLYAHELSHHWWGDLVTCETEEDMWLNEGWASFSEALFTEVIYGDQAYIDYVRTNHKDVLLSAHIDDGGRYPVSGIPHEITYGSHVYNKGADMVHTLRGYMGDQNFFEACRNFLEANVFSSINSEEMRDYFQQYTDRDLTAYFDNWIFAEGFPEYRIVSWSQPSSNQIELQTEHFKHYAPQYYQGLPMVVTCTDWNNNRFDTTIIIDEVIQNFALQLPFAFEVKSVILNKDNKISQAVLNQEMIITETGNETFAYAEFLVSVNNLGGNDSITLWVENHFAAANNPASIAGTNIVLSADRWWNVDGLFEGADIEGEIKYYGNNTSVTYYDPIFFTQMAAEGLTENEIQLYYRPDGASTWSLWPDFEIQTQGNATNFAGRVHFNGMLKGQYALGYLSNTTSVETTSVAGSGVTVFIDASNVIHMNSQKKEGEFVIYDSTGRMIVRLNSQEKEIQHSIQDLSAGTYLVVFGSTEETKTFHISKR